MLQLTKHFIRNWYRRVDDNPDPARVNRIVREAVRIQKGKKAVGRFATIKNLTVYCHFPMQIAITVDHYRNNAVSVYSEKNMPEHAKMKREALI